MITLIIVSLCGVLHLGFMFLEMYLWDKPAGRKIFKQTPEQSRSSKVLASNQGLYNGILAAGLFWSLMLGPAEWARQAQFFFLISVLVAGLYGAITVSRRIFWVQAFPAVLGLGAVYLNI